MPSAKVTLQINLAPGDYPHAKFILPHQLKAVGSQVDEVLLVLDTKASKGRFADRWEENKQLMDAFLDDIQSKYNVQVIPVDYSASAVSAVARCFFGNNNMPAKDFRGGPFYAYFFGLYKAKNRFVFHLDSDIFLGGGSQHWVTEAVDIFTADKNVLIVSPLPGPPLVGGQLKGQHILNELAPYKFQLDGMSTRLFLIDKSKFEDRKLKLRKPNLRSRLKALVQGNPIAELPEVLIADYMTGNYLKRIDFLGARPGLWSLHPPYRTATFYDQLPDIIRQVEHNDLPQAQQGFYDIVDEVCDWSQAREQLKQNRWWKTLAKHK